MPNQKCPRCQTEVPNLSPISLVMRQKFKLSNPQGDLPNSLCSNCFSEINSMLSKSSTATFDGKSKNDSKSKLWRSRVPLLKKGRTLMKRKSYGEAIVSYEKYIKLLEVVFEVSENGLRPEIFKERMATKELTIITSVYWDLMRVYDTNEKYKNRMTSTAQKLVQFAPYTPIAIDIVKKAEAYKRQAKNPDAFKALVRDLMYKKNHCFIATCVFDNPNDWHLIDLFRTFRDEVLSNFTLGRVFIKVYYRLSPPFARFLDTHTLFKFPIYLILKFIAKILR